MYLVCKGTTFYTVLPAVQSHVMPSFVLTVRHKGTATHLLAHPDIEGEHAIEQQAWAYQKTS